MVKKGKIEKVYRLYTKAIEAGEKSSDVIDQLAKKFKVSKRTIRGYIWRAKNPEKYRAVVQKYFERRKAKGSKADVVVASPQETDVPAKEE